MTAFIQNQFRPQALIFEVLLIRVPFNSNMGDKMSDNHSVSDKKYRSVLLEYLTKNGEMSATEAADVVERSAKTARRVLLQLVKEGVVTATGVNRNRRYRITQQ